MLLIRYKDVTSKFFNSNFFTFADQVSAAAAAASESGLAKSNCDDPLKSIEESEDGSTGNPVGQLQEFCVKHGLPMPVYDLGSVDGQPHQVKRKSNLKVKKKLSFDCLKSVSGGDQMYEKFKSSKNQKFLFYCACPRLKKLVRTKCTA